MGYGDARSGLAYCGDLFAASVAFGVGDCDGEVTGEEEVVLVAELVEELFCDGGSVFTNERDSWKDLRIT